MQTRGMNRHIGCMKSVPKIHTTIDLRVSFLFVCEIAVHSVSTSPEGCAFVDHEGLNDRLTSTERTPRRHDFRGDVIRKSYIVGNLSTVLPLTNQAW